MKNDVLFHGLPAIWLDKENSYLIYSPQRREFALVRNHQLGDPNLFHKLKQRGLFGPPLNDLPAESISLVLVVTKRCNLRCEYCFGDSGPSSKGDMIPRVAVGILSKMAGLVRLDRVHFIGGEATLNFPAICGVVEHAENLGIDPVYHITTNGVVPRRIIDWMTRRSFIFTVSWDGVGENHTRQRPLAGGQSSTKKVEDTILYLVKRNVKFRVRMTVTKSNLPCLAESARWCADLGVKFFHPEPMRPDGRGVTLLDEVISPHEFAEAFSEVLEIAEKRGIWVMNSALSNLFAPKSYFCSSVRGRTYHFNPDGSISLCYQVEGEREECSDFFTIGHHSVDLYGVRFDHGHIERLSTLGSDAYPSCRECFLRSLCSGGCPYRNMKSGSSGDVDRWTCQIRMGVLRIGILHLYRRALQGKSSCLEGTLRFYHRHTEEKEARYVQP